MKHYLEGTMEEAKSSKINQMPFEATVFTGLTVKLAY